MTGNERERRCAPRWPAGVRMEIRDDGERFIH
jgi:hypothetical protein